MRCAWRRRPPAPPPPHVRETLSQRVFARKLTVAEGLGVTAISRHAVDVELAAGTLAVVRLPGWKVRRHLSLVHSRDVPLTPAAQAFVAALRSAWTPARRGERKPKQATGVRRGVVSAKRTISAAR